MKKQAVCLVIDESPSTHLGKPEFVEINKFLKSLKVLGDSVALVLAEFNNARLEIQEPLPIGYAPELSPRYPEAGIGTALYTSIVKVMEAVQGYDYVAMVVLSDGRDNARNSRAETALGTFPKQWDLLAVGFEAERYKRMMLLVKHSKWFEVLSGSSGYILNKLSESEAESLNYSGKGLDNPYNV